MNKTIKLFATQIPYTEEELVEALEDCIDFLENRGYTIIADEAVVGSGLDYVEAQRLEDIQKKFTDSSCATGKRRMAGKFKWRYSKMNLFQIDFNSSDYYNDRFLIETLGAKLVPTGSDKYAPFEILQIEIRDFEHLEEIQAVIDREFNCTSTTLVSFDPPTLFIEL